MYYVYENWQASDKAIVHKASCPYCNNGKGTSRGTEGTAHGKWHGSFKGEDEAYTFAQSLQRDITAKCKHCLK